MKLTIEIPDKEIYEIGKKALKKKIEEYLEFMKLEKDIKKLSKELKKILSEEKYWQEVEKSREEAWEEYKKGFSKILTTNEVIKIIELEEK